MQHGGRQQTQREQISVAGRLSRQLENDIADAWKAIDVDSDQPIPARYRIPHLSLQLVGGPLEDDAIVILEDLAAQWAPFPIQLGGLGVFQRPTPVLYITVVRSPRLEAFQQAVTVELAGCGLAPHPLYRPESWVPHVSLAFGSPGITGGKRLLEQVQQGVFHQGARLEALLALSAGSSRPVLFEAALGAHRPRESGW